FLPIRSIPFSAIPIPGKVRPPTHFSASRKSKNENHNNGTPVCKKGYGCTFLIGSLQQQLAVVRSGQYHFTVDINCQLLLPTANLFSQGFVSRKPPILNRYYRRFGFVDCKNDTQQQQDHR